MKKYLGIRLEEKNIFQLRKLFRRGVMLKIPVAKEIVRRLMVGQAYWPKRLTAQEHKMKRSERNAKFKNAFLESAVKVYGASA